MQMVLGLLILMAAGGLGLLGLQAGGQVAQAVILLLSAGLGYGVWRAQENAKHTRDLEAKLITDKAALYKVYLDLVRGFAGTGQGTAPKDEAIVREMNRFVFSSMLNASDEVVVAHNRFLRASRLEPQPSVR